MPKSKEKRRKKRLNIEPNYKNKKKYNTAHYPIRQPIYLTGLIWVLSKILTIGKKPKQKEPREQKINKKAVVLQGRDTLEAPQHYYYTTAFRHCQVLFCAQCPISTK